MDFLGYRWAVGDRKALLLRVVRRYRVEMVEGPFSTRRIGVVMGVLVYDRNALFLIGVGSDAGGWRFNPVTGKWERVPGWEIERLSDLLSVVSVLDEVTKFKNPRLIDKVGTELGMFVHEELTAYLEEAGGQVGGSADREGVAE